MKLNVIESNFIELKMEQCRADDPLLFFFYLSCNFSLHLFSKFFIFHFFYVKLEVYIEAMAVFSSSW